MGLKIYNVFDKRTNRCTHIVQDGDVWRLPDGTPTSLPDEPDSKVYIDQAIGERFMLLCTGLAVIVYLLLK